MKYLALFGILALMCSPAKADLILTAVTATPSPFSAGSPITLNIFVRSTVAGGQQITGIDVNVNAATTANGTGTGAAGVFTSGNTFLLGNANFDTNPAGQAFASNFLAAGSAINFATGVGNDLGTLFGSVVLNTTGVADGTYFFNMDQLVASDLAFAPVVITGVGTTYTITTVPEPGTLAILGLGSCGLVAWRKRKRQPKIALRVK